MYNLSIYVLILLLNLDILTCGILFEYRLRCPDTAEKWRESSDSYICHGDTVYHCMQDQDGRYVVFCASSIWIQPDYCPEFNAKASLIDVILCQGAVEGCPGNIYLSNTVYQYPSCFRTLIRSTKPTPSAENRFVTRITDPRYTTWDQTKPKNEKERALTVSNEVIPGIVVGIILPILVFLVIIFFVRRKRQKKNKKETKSGIYDSKSEKLDEEEDTYNPQSETVPFLEESATDNHEESRGEVTFVIPKFYKDAVRILKEDGFILIVGVPGSGKTAFANYVVKANFTGFNVNYMKPKQTTIPELKSDKGDVVVWDDCFGIWKNCDLEEKEKTNVRNTVMKLIDTRKGKENHKTLICLDSCFDEKQLIDKFPQNFFNLPKNYETQIDKERFKNMFEEKIHFVEVSKDIGFPLLVKLIVEHHCPIKQADEFMKNPTIILNKNFSDLYNNDRDVYVTLVYMLCNTPSVNQRNIDWKAWMKLRDECQSKDEENNNNLQKESKDKDNDPQQECKDKREEAKNPSVESNFICKNPKCIEMNITLTKYLESREQNVFRFRHHFLARLLLSYHLENVGSKGMLEVGNKEIKSVVKKLQSPPSKLKPDQPVAS